MLAVSMPTARTPFATSHFAASGCSPGKCSFGTASAPRSAVPRYRAASGHRREKPVRSRTIDSRGHRPLLRLRVPEIVDGDLIVRARLTLLRHVNDHRRAEEALQRNLVNALVSLCEVHRRIEMCAAMLGHGEAVRGVVIAGSGDAVRLLVQPELARPWARRSSARRRRATGRRALRREIGGAGERSLPAAGPTTPTRPRQWPQAAAQRITLRMARIVTPPRRPPWPLECCSQRASRPVFCYPTGPPRSPTP